MYVLVELEAGTYEHGLLLKVLVFFSVLFSVDPRKKRRHQLVVVLVLLLVTWGERSIKVKVQYNFLFC
jgi:hypothetical protein